MPCAQFEALEARCQARRDRSVDSDKSTVEDNNDNEDSNEAEDPQGEPALIDTRILRGHSQHSSESPPLQPRSGGSPL
jgi:hypothetical protein